jgi:hypothetical protein
LLSSSHSAEKQTVTVQVRTCDAGQLPFIPTIFSTATYRNSFEASKSMLRAVLNCVNNSHNHRNSGCCFSAQWIEGIVLAGAVELELNGWMIGCSETELTADSTIKVHKAWEDNKVVMGTTST